MFPNLHFNVNMMLTLACSNQCQLLILVREHCMCIKNIPIYEHFILFLLLCSLLAVNHTEPTKSEAQVTSRLLLLSSAGLDFPRVLFIPETPSIEVFVHFSFAFV